jgi:alkylhydroperoxidase/carboxymuconolactone decarboxylase family protein YurZ
VTSERDKAKYRSDEKGSREALLKAEFIRARGYWARVWDQMLELSPDFFEAYTRLSSIPWNSGPLPPKVKELIYIALDASPTHLYEPGLRIHIRNALRLGASIEEIGEVLQLAVTVGAHSCTVGLPVLFEESERASQRDQHGSVESQD